MILFVIGIISVLSGMFGGYNPCGFWSSILAYLSNLLFFIIWVIGNIITIKRKQELDTIGWIDTIIILGAAVVFFFMMLISVFIIPYTPAVF